MNAVEVRGLHVRYERVEALQGVDFDVPRGTALGIVGPNGSGKSTLLKAVAGLLRPSAGSVRVQGRPPRELPPGTIGYVPQIEDVDWQFPVSVRDVIAMGRYPRLGPFRPFSAHDRSAVARAIEALDLGALADHHISALSGGQQQRTFVARAIAQEPLVLLLDEPSEGLAPIVVATIAKVLRELGASGATILLAEQNMHFCLRIAEEALVIDKGKVVHRQDTAGLAANEDIRRRYLAM